MKQILSLGLIMMLAFAASAQNNVTKFLGIPIDGTKSAMIQKLKAKGFTYNVKSDVLKGQFNGRDVDLLIGTNNNKVYRIVVSDAVGTTESNIKNRFNTLCNQFEKNGKYIPQNILGMYTIDENEDISYEMLVHNKRYQASYYQITEADKDTTGVSEWMLNKIIQEYGEEKWENMSDEEKQTAGLSMAIDYLFEKVSNKSVWFMIGEEYGKYYIYIYYDNVKNKANGEDL